MKIRYTESMIPGIIKNYLNTLCQPGAVLGFKGPLGAGKTTLVRQLMRELGVSGHITSPTYAYVNKYTTSNNIPIYHFDLYRLSDFGEFVSAGFEEYLSDASAINLIEWPEILCLNLPTAELITLIDISSTQDGKARFLEIKKINNTGNWVEKAK